MGKVETQLVNGGLVIKALRGTSTTNSNQTKTTFKKSGAKFYPLEISLSLKIISEATDIYTF